MTEIHTMRRIDWWRVVADLERKGYTQATIARLVGVRRTTVQGWKNGGKEPGYHTGCRLVALWGQVPQRLPLPQPGVSEEGSTA